MTTYTFSHHYAPTPPDDLFIVTEVYGWHGGPRKFMREGNRHWIEHEGGRIEPVEYPEWKRRLDAEPMPSFYAEPFTPASFSWDEPAKPWWKFW